MKLLRNISYGMLILICAAIGIMMLALVAIFAWLIVSIICSYPIQIIMMLTIVAFAFFGIANA